MFETDQHQDDGREFGRERERRIWMEDGATAQSVKLSRIWSDEKVKKQLRASEDWRFQETE